MRKSAVERFYDFVTPEPNSGCWLWLGACSRGYGYFSSKGKNILAHRFSYEEFVGQIPEGLQLDHLCRVRCCVNPAHLEAVTSKENFHRGISSSVTRSRHKKITHCPRGHAYEGGNLYVSKVGGRVCRKCRVIAQQNYVARKAQS